MTRATQIVEIGIKSKVYRKVSVSNAMEPHRPQGYVEDLRQTGSHLQAGDD